MNRIVALAIMAMSLGGYPFESFAVDAKPALMASMGDSITAAFLADTSLISGTGSPVQSQDTGINPVNHSWSAGAEIQSHFKRLSKRTGALKVINFALSGAKARDFENQAMQLWGAVKTGFYSEVEYVTVLFGANDLCSSLIPGGTPEDVFEQQLRNGFAVLAKIDQESPIRVLVSGLPRIPDLALPEIANFPASAGMTCSQLRNDLLHICQPLLRWETEQEHAALIEKVRSRNEIIRKVAADAGLVYRGRLDVTFSDALFQQGIQPEHLAADCFHPNLSGQSEISRVLWEAQPWFH